MELTQPFSWRLLSFRMAQLLLLYGVILLPTGAGHMNNILIAVAALALLSGQVKEKWAMIRAQRTTAWILLFSFILIASIFYTQGTLKYAIQGLVKYEKILFFIAYLPLLADKNFRDLVLNVFILSALISVVIIMSGLVEPEPLINAIDSAFIVSVVSFVLLRKYLEGGQWRWLYGALFVFVGAYLLLFNVERTGYLLFLGGLGTAFWQTFRWRGLLIGLSLILTLVVGLYSFSPSFQHRLYEGFQEARAYTSDDVKISRSIGVRLGLIAEVYKVPIESDSSINNFPSLYNTYLDKQGFIFEKFWFLHPHADIRLSSIGLRLGFMQYSWREIKKHPWFGNGNGSFHDVYWAGGGPTIGDDYLGHPHNEYILILFQFGVVGLMIFLLWQGVMWFESFQLPQQEQYLLQGLLVSFALLGLCNASLFVNPSGVVFVILATLFLAAKTDKRGRPWISR